jgi:hypothetical protein
MPLTEYRSRNIAHAYKEYMVILCAAEYRQGADFSCAIFVLGHYPHIG